MAELSSLPVARSPIRPPGIAEVRQGWEVVIRASAAELTVADVSRVAKLSLRAPRDGRVAGVLVDFGRARRDPQGTLVVGSGVGEWLLLSSRADAAQLQARLPAGAAEEFVSSVDITHGRAMLRLTGTEAARTLAKICAVDLSDRVTPNGAVFRSSVAKLAAEVVRDDRNGLPSYLVHCERSSGQYLFEVVLDAGREFSAEFRSMWGDEL